MTKTFLGWVKKNYVKQVQIKSRSNHSYTKPYQQCILENIFWKNVWEHNRQYNSLWWKILFILYNVGRLDSLSFEKTTTPEYKCVKQFIVSKADVFSRSFHWTWEVSITVRAAVMYGECKRRLFCMANLNGGFSQPTITCSELTIETLEQGVKYFQS